MSVFTMSILMAAVSVLIYIYQNWHEGFEKISDGLTKREVFTKSKCSERKFSEHLLFNSLQ
ncbi:hypothetical protein QFZ72_002394 [Bacillus sp. V2I10]|nr:hypothetical protein [Bacillus sp. V2I10]